MISKIRSMKYGTIIKIGNSYAIRVSKQYITDNHLKLGDRVALNDPRRQQQKAIAALLTHAKKAGPVKGMPDPVAWQIKQRH